ncbi:flp pilus-assembly TadE/G-like family protein [Micromonospora sp. WMMA1998]|uniref:Rv3654c family TadE-like protein n=1 Tax=Micromonospora sp. WMMA1998 TaxID=3015167 RepID=UPI00248BD1CD|nr:Rv3654c family TadE-like protein [Micromonospora sp. WMMA1998]WBC13583.1 flp pilus-assembly TadE/G-like family protein [Micromonospora sp. WMMA1998]
MRPERSSTPTRHASAERGGATVCLLAIGLVFVLVGLFGAGLGAARCARHQARVAADFGALAGAVRVLDGVDAACARAAVLVSANGGRLAACRVDGLDLIVTAQVRVVPLPGLARVAAATSRAGPVRAVDG